MNFTKLFSWAAALLFVATAAQAQLPTGRYSGFVSNNAFNEWCRLNQGTLDFRPNSDGSVQLWWEETGFANFPTGGFCENRFDAVLTPVEGKPDTWDVRFNWNFDLNFGRAQLKNGVLTINATYTGFRTGNQALNTRLIISEDGNSINYQRRIDRWGPTFFANGTLRK